MSSIATTTSEVPAASPEVSRPARILSVDMLRGITITRPQCDAIEQAVRRDPRVKGIPSTKGML